MYQYLQPKPEGAIFGKRSKPRGSYSSPHDTGASIADWPQSIIQGSPWRSVRVPWTGGRTSMCSACCPRSDLPADASLPSTGSSGASSPASSVLSRRYDFLPPVPPHFVSFAWRYLRVHSLGSLPGGRVHRRGPELLTRSPGRELAEEATGSRKFLGNPDCPFAHVPSTPAGLRSPDHRGGAAWP